jgi:hypothetical protein
MIEEGEFKKRFDIEGLVIIARAVKTLVVFLSRSWGKQASVERSGGSLRRTGWYWKLFK